ncbi:TonB-dependent receptor [Arenimonas oryziterrae]|uniref:Uncharacterized protein n=1 Tax=Arenimonas oryziterrae DSM 21050 = YC6267 TaxID=1121015 RepID=A0A091AY03_9GAMM|nr:TonB-dependent receptor [Arenimonas oryziterrae]KFN43504.1 hypothetical protein N789_09525 [Arenimonas oryziterrae DSM 21050 = YC6267]
MASKIINKGLKRTALSLALGMCFAGAVQAQSNTNGSVFGQATSGDTIIVENASTGFKREISVSSDGSYRASSLPTGTYKVTVKHADGTTSTRDNVAVNVGTGTPVNFAANSATEIGAVEVSGAGAVNPIDVSSVESNTILTEAQIDRIPVGRNVTSLALLAPGTTRGDARMGEKSLASFGGASVAENVYYINGFNVTNILSGTAFNEVPFEAVSEIQIKTGGYGAEFGRSLGGVANVITKKGSNDWKFGGNIIWSPDEGRAPTLRSLRDAGTATWNLVPVPGYANRTIGNIYASGPILKDRLFFYALVQGLDATTKAYGNTTQTEAVEDQPQYLAKIDWNITDSHHFELTYFSDEAETVTTTYRSPQSFKTPRTTRVGGIINTRGGENYIGKWTGYLTDNFTLSALYGVGKYSRQDSPDPTSARDDCPVVQDQRAPVAVSYGCWVAANWVPKGTGDKRTAWRIDGEWALGDHTVRFGLDNETFDSVDGTERSGPEKTGYIITNLANGGTLANGYTNVSGSTIAVVNAREFHNGGTFSTENKAWYIEDNWQVTDNFIANLGIRNESFTNLNAAGLPFIEIKNTWAPRLGFSWDVHGDSSTKIFGTAGRYYIPVYSNTNVRLSGSETDITTYYQWTGTFAGDAAQRPGLGAQLGPVRVTSDGSTPNPLTVVDPNLKPLFQDEYILGFQQQVSSDWAVGVRAIYRSLKSNMDDYCSYDFPYNWAVGAGYSTADADTIASTVNHCFLMNPGTDLTANVDFGSGTLTPVTIPKAALGLPDPKRTYKALEFFFERAWDGKWYMQGSYTFAKSIGNTEGYVKSDIGQDDAGITQDFDYPGLTEGTYGYLPNDRRHSLKVFGAYQINDQWRVGGNFIMQSGRPKNCLGFYSGTFNPEAIGYGASSFYCNRVLGSRGDRGTLDWSRELSFQVTYEPTWAEGLRISADVFNVFNERTVTSINERGESAAGTVSPNYEQPLSIQQPRSFRLTLEYDFK